jgi:hypothetical protein
MNSPSTIATHITKPRKTHAQTKACQRVCLSQRKDNKTKRKNKKNGVQQNLYAIPFGILRIAKPLAVMRKNVKRFFD